MACEAGAERQLLAVAADLAKRRDAERVQRVSGPHRIDFAARLAKVPQRPEPTAEMIAERTAAQAREAAENARQERLRRKLAIVAQVGRRYERATLETFKATTVDQRDVLSEVSDYARNIGDHVREGVGLVLMGPSGTGKDHLTTAVMFVAADAGFSVKWVNGVSLFAGARDAIRNDDSEKSWVDRYVSPDVLAISDPVPPAGMIREGWQISKLFEILDGRYREQKPTMLTINVASREEAVGRMSENVVQRIEDRCIVVTCNWPSYRRPRE